MSTRVVRLRDFSTTPGGRHVADGPASAEAFRDQVLRPAFEAARADCTWLIVNVDDVAGLPASFLDEVFGGMARVYGRDAVTSRLVVECSDDPYVAGEIRAHILGAMP